MGYKKIALKLTRELETGQNLCRIEMPRTSLDIFLVSVHFCLMADGRYFHP